MSMTKKKERAGKGKIAGKMKSKNEKNEIKKIK